MRSPEALINPAMLVWARESAGLSVDQAAGKMGVAPARLTQWEDGTLRPTTNQLWDVARVYRQSFAMFYLRQPPAVFVPPVRDFRRTDRASAPLLSSAVTLDIRDSLNRRQVLLELLADTHEAAPAFNASTRVDADCRRVAQTLRHLLRVTLEAQTGWRDSRRAFNAWREAAEDAGVLVFQFKGVPLEEMRGYCLAETPLPVIVVNRKDTHNGRIFTLMHELTHVMLHSSSLCDTSSTPSPEHEQVEAFCNHVAAEALVPADDLLAHEQVNAHQDPEWADETLAELGRHYSVSREVVLTRLLSLGRTSDGFYARKRSELRSQYSRRQPGSGGPSPPIDVLSAAGKPFVRVVMGALNRDRITASDAVDLLGIRLKHFDALARCLAGGV